MVGAGAEAAGMEWKHAPRQTFPARVAAHRRVPEQGTVRDRARTRESKLRVSACAEGWWRER